MPPGSDPTDESRYYQAQPSSPTETDPFPEGRSTTDPSGRRATSSSPGQSSLPSSAPYPPGAASSSSGRFYQHEGSALHAGGPAASEADDRSYLPSTEGSEPGDDEDAGEADGSYHHGVPGGRIAYPPTMSEGSDEEEEEEEDPHEGEPPYSHPSSHPSASGSGYESVPATSGPPPPQGYPPQQQPGGVDYSGSSWGPGVGWESMTPRHRHPTRLSDVPEEDERSRTNPSRASQASRSLR